MVVVRLADSARQVLLQDPLIWEMAARVREDLSTVANPDGTPDIRFRDACNQLYRNLGRDVPRDLDAVAKTVLDIRTASPDEVIGMWSPPHTIRTREGASACVFGISASAPPSSPRQRMPQP